MTDARQPGSDLHRQILDQTRYLLVAEGYNNLSMRKIARAVGCSATSIYLHFDSKDDLVHALIDEGMERLNDELSRAASGEAVPDRLAALGRAYVGFGLANPEYYEIMFLLHPGRMARYPAAKYRRARRNLVIFAEALEEGARAGLLDVPDPEVSASVLWAALHGTVTLLLARRIDVRMDRDAFIEAVVEHALTGFRSQSARLE
jgi:AcrR family transcriptional regulator